MPRFATLQQWLRWQQQLHPRAIDLGLERVHQVMARLLPATPPFTTIIVGGTNGKGSSVAFLETMLRAGGYRTGAYTSPHLLRYNERIRVDGQAIDDAFLCQAFTRVDEVRQDVALTFFEFGTLAALDIFWTTDVDVAILEVGLGGRLDAVNCLDANAALVTGIGIDHVQWLGPDRESIGREKAGIYRTGRPAICADRAPPESLLTHARAIDANLLLAGRDYDFHGEGAGWRWWGHGVELRNLPEPALAGAHQLHNAAAAVATLMALSERLPLSVEAIHRGLVEADVAGRFQVIPGPVEWILDVAHNPSAAAILAHCLEARPCPGKTWAVVGMFADKDVASVAHALSGGIDHWLTATLDPPRGLSAEGLAKTLLGLGVMDPLPYPGISQALLAVERRAETGDRIVVFGSFSVVAEALRGSVCLRR